MRIEVAASERYRAAIARILGCDLLSDAPAQRKLLAYLAEKAFAGTGDLKEYGIGTELYGKPTDYSPQTDPSVRMQASRLRTKLEEYYRGGGLDSDVVIRLPKGSFHLVFEERNREPAGAEERPEPPVAEPRRNRVRWTLVAGLVLLTACAIELRYIVNLQNDVRRKELDPSVARLWQPVLMSPRPLLLIVGVPMVIGLGDGYYRNGSANTPEDVRQSASLQALFHKWEEQPKRLAYVYTGVGESVGMFNLGQLFQAAGKKVNVARSNTLSWDDATSHDLVILGSVKSNPYLRELPYATAYKLVPGGIQVTTPVQGEPSVYRPVFGSGGDTVSDYALVSRLPGLNRSGFMVSIGSESTEGNWAAANYVVQPKYAQELIAKMAASDGRIPEYFELVLHADFKGGLPVRIDYVRHRSFK